MGIINTLLWVIQIVSAITIIVLVLLQQGKGADAGATFGSGGSSSLFGASGSANFLSRTTAIFAIIFFVTTLGLVIFGSNTLDKGLGVMSQVTNKPESSSVVKPAVAVSTQESALKTESVSKQIPE